MNSVQDFLYSPSAWRWSKSSTRWWPVFRRNLLAWRKSAIPSLIGNIVEPLIWLAAFGYGMSSLIGRVEVAGGKIPYLLFIGSGSICMSAMNAASFEALYTAFTRMHIQKTWEGIMNAPIAIDDIVMAEMLWASFKSLFNVTAIILVMFLLGVSRSPKLIVAWCVLAGTGITFSSLALVCNALAKNREIFWYYFTLFTTPMAFLSGVFFPVEQLPPTVGAVSAWLPLSNAIALVRPLFMDKWPSEPLRPVVMLVIYATVAFWGALVLTRKRFRA